MKLPKKFSKFIQKKWFFLTSLLVTFSLVLILGISGYWLYTQGFFIRSYLEISLEGKKMLFNFKVNPAERLRFEQLSTDLGLSGQWLDGMSLVLSDKSAQEIKGYLPIKAKMHYELKEKKLVFYSTKLQLLPLRQLQSSVPQQLKEASSEEQLGWYLLDPQTVVIKISQPDRFLDEATKSKELKIAPTFQSSLWPILKKLGTIDISVSQGNLEGSINLDK